MDEGRLLVFLEDLDQWKQLLADLEASGAICTMLVALDEAQEQLAKGEFDGLLVSRATFETELDLRGLSVPILLAEDLGDGSHTDLIDPFAELGARSVLSTLDRHLDRVEALIASLEERC